MDSIFPLLESAFSKAFGNLTQIDAKSISKTDYGSSSVSLTTNWNIAILSYGLIYANPNYLVGGSYGTILVTPTKLTIGPSNSAFINVEANMLEVYSPGAIASVTATIITFKQS